MPALFQRSLACSWCISAHVVLSFDCKKGGTSPQCLESRIAPSSCMEISGVVRHVDSRGATCGNVNTSCNIWREGRKLLGWVGEWGDANVGGHNDGVVKELWSSLFMNEHGVDVHQKRFARLDPKLLNAFWWIIAIMSSSNLCDVYLQTRPFSGFAFACSFSLEVKAAELWRLCPEVFETWQIRILQSCQMHYRFSAGVPISGFIYKQIGKSCSTLCVIPGVPKNITWFLPPATLNHQAVMVMDRRAKIENKFSRGARVKTDMFIKCHRTSVFDDGRTHWVGIQFGDFAWFHSAVVGLTQACSEIIVLFICFSNHRFSTRKARFGNKRSVQNTDVLHLEKKDDRSYFDLQGRFSANRFLISAIVRILPLHCFKQKDSVRAMYGWKQITM